MFWECKSMQNIRHAWLFRSCFIVFFTHFIINGRSLWCTPHQTSAMRVKARWSLLWLFQLKSNMYTIWLLSSIVTCVWLMHADDIEKRQAQRLRARPGALKRRPSPTVTAADSDPTPPGKRVVCYYANWSVYRKGQAKFVPQNINPYLCTHLVYAFGGLTDEFEMTAFDSYQDIEKGTETLKFWHCS